MWLSSHALRCATRRWGTSNESGRLCTLCPKQVREFEYHTLIQCTTFDHIGSCFPHIFEQTQSLHTVLSQPQCALSIATFIGKVLEHWDSLLTFTCVMWNVNIFGRIGHIWPPKMIIESTYLFISHFNSLECVLGYLEDLNNPFILSSNHLGSLKNKKLSKVSIVV